MIFTIFFTLAYLFLYGILSILPSVELLPSVIGTSLSYLFGFMWNFNYIIDVPSLFTILGLTLAFEFGVVVWHAAHWLIKKIPFIHIR